jgi:hypothetical protein
LYPSFLRSYFVSNVLSSATIPCLVSSGQPLGKMHDAQKMAENGVLIGATQWT